jgi:hypothetical protein
MEMIMETEIDFEFSKPAKKSKSAVIERVKVDVLAQAMRYRELNEKFNSIKAEMETVKGEMLEAVMARREELLRSGESDPKIDSDAGYGHKIQFNFKDMFRPRERGQDLAKLKGVFGADFPTLIEETEKLSFRDGMTVKAIETAIGEEAWIKLKPHVEVVEGFAPRKGAVAEVARLFREGKTRLAEILLKLVNATSDKPSVVVR